MVLRSNQRGQVAPLIKRIVLLSNTLVTIALMECTAVGQRAIVLSCGDCMRSWDSYEPAHWSRALPTYKQKQH
eukprot:458825-Amphidinium_carterae.1